MVLDDTFFFYLWLFAGAFALSASAVTLQFIYQHLRHYYEPNFQKFIIRLLWMVPVRQLPSFRYPHALVGLFETLFPPHLTHSPLWLLHHSFTGRPAHLAYSCVALLWRLGSLSFPPCAATMLTRRAADILTRLLPLNALPRVGLVPGHVARLVRGPPSPLPLT